jgi:hypothetical protein
MRQFGKIITKLAPQQVSDYATYENVEDACPREACKELNVFGRKGQIGEDDSKFMD